MTLFTRRLLVAIATIVFALPGAALAADPPSGPMTARANIGFEEATYGDLTWGVNPTPPGYTPVAWWGRITATKHAGAYSLWCAGSSPSSWALYPEKTSGRATLALSQLENYYSSVLDFWWVQPSYGDADTSSFVVFWQITPGGAIDSYSYFPKRTAWQHQTFDLSTTLANDAVLSRKAGQVMFEFNDKTEGGTYTATRGQGASVDDVKVSGYYYGPVRGISAPPASTDLQVSWIRPYRATNSTTLEERSIAYKVWRRTYNPGPGAWTELTSVGGTTSVSITDTAPPQGVELEYRIHAWESGGSAYGEPVTVAVDQPPALSDNAQPLYSSTANIVLTASDTSGVGAIFYKKEGGATESVGADTTTVTFTGDGPHTLEWWATDAHGTSADHITRNFTINSSLPDVSADLQPYYTTLPASIHITGSDPDGIATVSWRMDGGTTQTVAASSADAPVPGEGSHTIEYWATDNFSNESPHVNEGFVVDVTDPVPGHDGVSAYVDSASINVWADDAVSGVKTLSWRIDGGSIQTDTTPPFEGEVTAGLGSHTLQVWAEDKAGNVADTITFPFTVSAPSAERLSDRTRFSTAVAIAREGFDADGNPDNGTQWTGVGDVVIASGDDRAAADPLAASGLCWAYDAPLFLVSASSTPGEVKTAIKQIADQNGHVDVHIVGGPVSVPDARYSEIAAYVGASKLTKDRLLSTGGRYELAAEISKEMQGIAGFKPDTVLIANGADPTKFFDALALSPIAAANGYPILLVTATGIPSATQARIDAIGPSTMIVGGGPNTVSESVRAALGAERWSGRTRYDTAIEIADEAIRRVMLSDEVVGIAAKLPDALTGGSMVGLQSGVLLLTDGASLTSVTGNWLSSHKGNIQRTYVFGGPNSVSAGVLAQINARID